MRIRAKVNVYNDILIAERQKLGLTQIQFAQFCGLGISDYQAIETLKMVPGATIEDIRCKLQQVADALCMTFDAVFPPDYLQMLVENRLPRRRKALEFVREVSIDELPPSVEMLALPDPAEMIVENLTQEEVVSGVRDALSDLGDRERLVMEMRLGIDAERPLTYEEIGKKFGLTGERLRQVESKAVEKLRRSKRIEQLHKDLGGT